MIELASATRTSSAAPDSYFSRWIDHDSWAQWSPDTAWVRLEGPVQVGTRGLMKPVGGPKVKFVISECETDRIYTDVTKMPGATLTFRHTVEADGAGSRLGVNVTVAGPMSWLWAKTAFSGFSTSVPEDLDRLIALVESA